MHACICPCVQLGCLQGAGPMQLLMGLMDTSQQPRGSCCMSLQCLPAFQSQQAPAPQAARATAWCPVACQLFTGSKYRLSQEAACRHAAHGLPASGGR